MQNGGSSEARAQPSRLLGLASALALLVLIAASDSQTPKGAFDDLASMRLSAWLDTCSPDDALPLALRAHFERYSPQLPPIARERFQLRSATGGNYALTALLSRFAERAGAPGLRAVIIACLAQHLLAAIGVLLVAGRRHTWLLLALLAAALPGVSAWPRHVDDLFPFQRDNLSWLAAMPRGAAVLAWFAALMAWLDQKGPRKAWAASAFALLSVLCHRSVALLCFGSTLPVLGLWFAAWRYVTWRPGKTTWICAFFALASFVGGVKLWLLVHYHSAALFPLTPGKTSSTPSPLRPALTLAAWAVGVAVLLWAWLRGRSSSSLTPALRSTGDLFAVLLGVTGAVALGANAVHPGTDLWFGSLFFVTEASMRLVAVPNLLFFCLAALAVQALAAGIVPRTTWALAALVALFATVLLTRQQSPLLPDRVSPLEQLLATGRRAYLDETTYYLSAGTQLATRGCGPP
jgi:hypothetical protein